MEMTVEKIFNEKPQAPAQRPNKFLYASKYNFVSDNTLEVVAVTGGINRFDEIIDVRGGRFENFLKNPVVLWSHDWDSLPIARTTAIDVEDDLIETVEFSPFPEAQSIKTLYKLGFLNAWSIGFFINAWVNEKLDGKDVRRVTDWEQLELSAVVIPADADALVARYHLKNSMTQPEASDMPDWQKTAMRMQHLIAEIRKSREIKDTEYAMLNELTQESVNLQATRIDADVVNAARFFVNALAIPSYSNVWLDFVNLFGRCSGIVHQSQLDAIYKTLNNVKTRLQRAR